MQESARDAPGTRPLLPPRTVLLIAVLSLGSAAILIRLIEDAPAATIAFYRLFLTLIILSPIAFLRYRHQFRLLSRKDLIISLVIGFFLAVHFATWIESLFHTSVASSVIIVSTEALFAALGAAIFLRERLYLKEYGLILLAFVGVGLIALGDAREAHNMFPNALYGNLLALIGALAAAFYLVAGRSVRKRVHLLVYVTVVYWSTSLFLLLFVLLTDAPLSGFAPRTWTLLLLLALLPTIGGHTLINWSLRYLPAAPVATAVIGEPLIATGLAILLFAEIPGPLAALGGALTLLGILGVVRRRPRPQESATVAGPGG
jgi:drug/metabolite transporter (DMT)-like permease